MSAAKLPLSAEALEALRELFAKAWPGEWMAVDEISAKHEPNIMVYRKPSDMFCNMRLLTGLWPEHAPGPEGAAEAERVIYATIKLVAEMHKALPSLCNQALAALSLSAENAELRRDAERWRAYCKQTGVPFDGK